MKALLLDAGGTIVFPNFRKIARELEREGIEVDADAMQTAEAKVRFELDDPAVVRSTSDALRWARYLKSLFHFVGATHVPMRALWRIKTYHDKHNLWDYVPRGIPAALDRLGKRFRLGVVSNSNGTVRELLKRLGLADRFETIVDSQEEGIEKPDPRIFRIALERMKIKAADTAYVGDLYYVDVIGARSAGLRPFLLDPFSFYTDKRVSRVKTLNEILNPRAGMLPS